jgi:hypothetical protein
MDSIRHVIIPVHSLPLRVFQNQFNTMLMKALLIEKEHCYTRNELKINHTAITVKERKLPSECSI